MVIAGDHTLSQPGRAAGLRFFSPGLLVLLLAAAPAAAHDFWVEPARTAPAPGETVGLGLWSGDGFVGSPVPRSEERIARFSVLTGDAEEAVEGVEGVHPAGFFTPSEAAPFWVVFESRPRRLVLAADRFERYLLAEGLERIVELRRQRGQSEAPGRESYRRCAKTLIEAGGSSDGLGAAIAGCPLELVLETPPRTAAAAGRLELRLLFRGRPLGGARVAALRRGTPGETLETRTDGAGRAEFPVAGAGLWLFKAVHAESAPETLAGIEWQSWWASLTLRLPGG